ncbi:hypothetical protein ASG17_10475 [Brevundimonas sp. Leaf363]|uniref:DUF3667 domain-containing protein n=1 Tax=Brevundimonas sp. Leaf363 TaxID=1736353 RepID=UPI0006F1DC22|nr:DUF3667 domain-containing protein [Brevundimonas sp. Leaf363]KQS56407.1 hypothetical protein ASG17_10475 [Brevundimonas sp. Leaf363]
MTDEPASCAACGAMLMGRYCYRCGQDTLARPRPLRELAMEAFSETNLVDTRTARTMAALALRPGELLEAYRSGAGSRYATPIKIFVVMTALFLLVLNFSDVVIYQYVRQVEPGATVTARADPDGYTVHLIGATESDRWMQRRIEPSIDPRIPAAIQAAADRATSSRDKGNLLYELQTDREQDVITQRLADWLPNALWLLMPLYALLLTPLFGRNRLFLEHAVFAMWAHALAFGLLIMLALINKFNVGMPAWPLVIPYLGYFAIAARRYYGERWVQVGWKAVVHTGLYVLMVLIPAAVLVSLSALDIDAFMAYVRS